MNDKYEWKDAGYQHFLIQVGNQEVLGHMYVHDLENKIYEYRTLNVRTDEKKRFLNLESAKKWLEGSVLGFHLE